MPVQERTDKVQKALRSYIEWIMASRRKLKAWEQSAPPRGDAPITDTDLKNKQRQAVIGGADPAIVEKFTLKAPASLVGISGERRLLKSLGFTKDEDGIALSQAAARPNKSTDAKPFGGDPNKEYIASMLGFRKLVARGGSVTDCEVRSLKEQARCAGCDPMLLNNFGLAAPQSTAGRKVESDLLVRFGYSKGKDGA